MTIPTRPAPAPPGSGSAAAAGANASLEQLRRQLQQQHLEQQQQHHQQQQQQQQQQTQKLTIKLPPPPKGGRPLQQQSATKKSFNNNYFDDSQTGGGSNITRKFPQARLYTPATNWDDDPFGGGNSNTSNGNALGLKKMPPPRPPPPKVQVNRHRSNEAAASGGSGNRLIPNIFQRKKATNTSSATAAATKVAAQNRVYGLSSGQVAGSNAGGLTTTSSSSLSSSTNYDWNAAWNTATTSSSTSGSNFVGSSMASSSSTSGAGVAEGQLISFDSPPSSPTFTQKSNSDCVSVDSFSSDSNFSSPNNGSVSQPESGFEDDYHHRSRPSTQSPLDPWEAVDSSGGNYGTIDSFGSAPVRQMQLQGRSSDNPLCNGKSLLPPTQSLQMPTIIKPKISQKPKAPKPPPFIGGMPGSYLGGATGGCTPPSPPMPKGEPPKLPSTTAGMGAASGGICLLDVISGKVDALALSKGTLGYIEEEQIPYAIALYDFDGVEEGDLNFRENEKIYLLEQPTPEWLRGRTRAGCEGIFPANYVEIKVPLSSNSNQLVSPPTPSPVSVQATARCLYQFPGEVEGDLPLQENDLVTVLYRINDDWLYGEIDGRQGQFPANFLEHIPQICPQCEG